MQTLADGMMHWFLVLAIGLSGVAAAAAYYGLFVVAASFASIVFVAFTLYAFLRSWPEDEPLKLRPPSKEALVEEESARQVAVPVVQLNGAPRTRFMSALKEIARRQDDYKISKRGAERFAKVIRYMLQHSDLGR